VRVSDALVQPTLESIIAGLASRIAALERQRPVPSFTTTTRPAASNVVAGTIIFVSDATDGQRFQGSDGASWKILG